MFSGSTRNEIACYQPSPFPVSRDCFTLDEAMVRVYLIEVLNLCDTRVFSDQL